MPGAISAPCVLRRAEHLMGNSGLLTPVGRRSNNSNCPTYRTFRKGGWPVPVSRHISSNGLLTLLMVSCSGSPALTQTGTSTGGATGVGGDTSTAGTSALGGNPSIGGTVESGGATQTSSTSATGSAPLFGFPGGISTGRAETLVSSGLPSALGKSGTVTNIGASGTIEVTASVTGGSTVSSQFVVEAGVLYVLTVCVPVNASSGGPWINVTFPGSNATLASGNTASTMFGFNGPATGAPVIGLTQDSKAIQDIIGGKIPCPTAGP